MPDWNTLFTEKENRWENLFEDVVSLVESHAIEKGQTVLDLGCGAGRHLAYLEEHGINCTGSDISINGLLYSRARLQDVQQPIRLVMADMGEVFPFSDDSFNHVISIHVIFHNKRLRVQATIDEIRRVVKPGGLVLITFISTYSSRYQSGFEIEKDTWLPDVGVDMGVPHHFSSLADVVDLMNGFKVTRIWLEEKENGGRVSCHWIVTAKKEA